MRKAVIVWVHPEMHATIKTRAKKQNRSMSSYIRYLVENDR